MTKSKVLGALLAAVVGLGTVPAQAGFINEAEDSTRPDADQVKVIGSEKGGFEDAVGMGRHQALSEAITQIVPKRYTVQMSSLGGALQTPVDWKGNRLPWPDVVRQMLTAVPEISAEIDVSTKTVTLKRREGGELARNVAASNGDFIGRWNASTSDKTIRGTLTRWGKAAGYSVIWDVDKDISVDADAGFSGNFEEAVQQVLDAVSASEFPVEGVLYDNRVLRIVKTARRANGSQAK